MKLAKLSLLSVAVVTLSAAKCLGLAENAVISLNMNGLDAVFDVNPSQNPTFGPPEDCETIDDSTYLDDDFDTIAGARVYDIRVQTIGSFGGTVQNGRVTVDGVEAATFGGAWNDFNTPQSVLSSSLINVNQVGINALVQAVENRQSVTICAAGSVNQPITDTGLQVRVEVLGQIDAEL